MPFMYETATKQTSENYNTSGTANTEIDFCFLKPGASRALILARLGVQGKAAAGTTLSGIAIRAKHWTTTAAAGGTATTPAPKHNLAPACVATAGMGTGGGTAAVTSGTGGPNIVGVTGMGTSGPGGINGMNPDDLPTLDGGANKSLDLFSSSGGTSLPFEADATHQEA